MFTVLNTLSESRLIPSQSTLRHFSAEDMAELAVLYICALYILDHYEDSKSAARNYAKRTIQYGTDFDRWRVSASDLYAILYALEAKGVNLRDPANSDRFRDSLPMGMRLLIVWLKAMATNTMSKAVHRNLFTRLDQNFRIRQSSIRAVRRAVMDWDDLDNNERRLTMTRLMQLIRVRAPKSEILPLLNDVANRHHLDVDGVGTKASSDYLSTGASERKEGSLMLALAGVAAGVAMANTLKKKNESASAGATGAASVATVVGGIGSGFDPNGDKGIYQDTKSDSKKKKPLILRR
jgi:hypothetical protein